MQACKGVERLDGDQGKLGAPMLEPKVFHEQMYCISNCDIVGTFRRPLVSRHPGHCAPLPSLGTPLITCS